MTNGDELGEVIGDVAGLLVGDWSGLLSGDEIGLTTKAMVDGGFVTTGFDTDGTGTLVRDVIESSELTSFRVVVESLDDVFCDVTVAAICDVVATAFCDMVTTFCDVTATALRDVTAMVFRDDTGTALCDVAAMVFCDVTATALCDVTATRDADSSQRGVLGRLDGVGWSVRAVWAGFTTGFGAAPTLDCGGAFMALTRSEKEGFLAAVWPSA